MFVNLNALYGGAVAPDDDEKLVFFKKEIRCQRCGERAMRGQWACDIAEGCEDNDCPMKGYEP